MAAEGRKRIGRAPLLLMGIGCLVAGVWGGLVRLPLNLPLAERQWGGIACALAIGLFLANTITGFVVPARPKAKPARAV
jgi:hypothetical protein